MLVAATRAMVSRRPVPPSLGHALWHPPQVDAYRRGDERILAHLYTAHFAGVRSLAQRRLNRRDDASLDDVVQETFVRAFSERARLAYDARRPFHPYLLAIADNVIVDQLRERRRRERALEGPALDGGHDTLNSAVQPAQVDPLLRDVLIDYIEDLGAIERQVFSSRYLDETSQRTTAKVLRLSHQTVRTIEKRLTGELRSRLRLPNPALTQEAIHASDLRPA